MLAKLWLAVIRWKDVRAFLHALRSFHRNEKVVAIYLCRERGLPIMSASNDLHKCRPGATLESILADASRNLDGATIKVLGIAGFFDNPTRRGGRRIEKLAAQVDDLTERLEIASAPRPTSSHYRGEHYVAEARLERLRKAVCGPADAIELERSLRAREIELDKERKQLQRLCANEAKLLDAAKACGHAGLEYLATEIDWPEMLTRYGADEAGDLVRSLTVARDVYDVRQVLADWRGE